MNRILVLSILLCLFSFSEADYSAKSEIDIVGKWNYANGVYEKTDVTIFTGRSYEFNNNGKVEYSTCTDPCGCLPITYSGSWSWKNDGILSITYVKYKRDELLFMVMEESRNEKLKIKKSDKNTLEITILNSEL